MKISSLPSSISKQSSAFIPAGSGANVHVAPAIPNAGPTLPSVVTLMPTASKTGTPNAVNASAKSAIAMM